MTVVLITGANRGIGLELARHYAGKGARVHACCRDPERADDLLGVVGDVSVHGLDTTDEAAVSALAAKIDEPIDIVIANAGIYGKEGADQSFASLDLDGLRHTFEVNTIGTIRTLQAFLPHARRSTGKTLVAITSKMGSISDASGGVVAYRVSKCALNMAMAAAAHELEGEGISVATLHPGWVRTRMGGPHGLVSAEESAAGLARVIAGLRPGPKAPFLDYSGKEIPW